MDPKLLCPTLTIMLTKTIKALCEVNIRFEEKLEISGSLHIRSDGDKVLTCLIDEESHRSTVVTGQSTVGQRSSPETAVAQHSAVMALLTASQQMTAASNRPSGGVVAPPSSASLDQSELMSCDLSSLNSNNNNNSDERTPLPSMCSFMYTNKNHEQKVVLEPVQNGHQQVLCNGRNASPQQLSPNSSRSYEDLSPPSCHMTAVSSPITSNGVLPPFPVLLGGSWPALTPDHEAADSKRDTESPVLKDTDYLTTVNSKGQKKFQCMFCGILLSTKNYLKNHINAVHTKARVYPCEICDRYFYSAGALRIHKLRHHWAGSKKHRCHRCPETFLLPVELRRHLVKKHGVPGGQSEDESSHYTTRAHRLTIQQIEQLKQAEQQLLLEQQSGGALERAVSLLSARRDTGPEPGEVVRDRCMVVLEPEAPPVRQEIGTAADCEETDTSVQIVVEPESPREGPGVNLNRKKTADDQKGTSLHTGMETSLSGGTVQLELVTHGE